MPGDHARAELRELALGEVGKAPEQLLGDHELKDGVAQELKALVVEGIVLPLQRDTGVGEGFRQQEGVSELVSDPLLQRIHQVTGMKLGTIHAAIQ